jgi:hypothetical protein
LFGEKCHPALCLLAKPTTASKAGKTERTIRQRDPRARRR